MVSSYLYIFLSITQVDIRCYTDDPTYKNPQDAIIYLTDNAINSSDSFKQYVHSHFGMQYTSKMSDINWNISPAWNWSDSMNYQNDMVNFINKSKVKVFVGAGYFDLCVPYLTQHAWMDSANMKENLTDSLHVYYSGHMLYLDPTARGELYNNVKTFFRNCKAD